MDMSDFTLYYICVFVWMIIFKSIRLFHMLYPSKLVTNEKKKPAISLSSQSLQLCLFRYTFSCLKRMKIIRRSSIYDLNYIAENPCWHSMILDLFFFLWFVCQTIQILSEMNRILKLNGMKQTNKNAFLFCISFVGWLTLRCYMTLPCSTIVFHSLLCQISCHCHNFHFYTSVKHAWNVFCMNVM